MLYSIAGLLGGAVTGILSSFLMASVMTPNCFADDCLMRYTPALTVIGMLLGLLGGVHLARLKTG